MNIHIRGHSALLGSRGCFVSPRISAHDSVMPTVYSTMWTERGRFLCKVSSDADGALPFMSGMSAEEILAVPVERRRKTTAEECPFCADAPVKEDDSKCLGVCRNPQNVPGPEVFPHEMQEVTDAVRLQLNAMRDLHVPRTNHGIQVMYQFAVEAAQMERSRYFGMSTDMYHFDHFMAKALWSFDDMIDMKGYEIMEPKLREDGRTDVQVKITTKVGTERLWTFIMVQRTFGMYTGCWQSHRVLPSDSKWIDEV